MSLERSQLHDLLDTAAQVSKSSDHPAHFHQLAATILQNLQYQHDWTQLSIHTTSSVTGQALPRPIISGLPPRRAYVHPDEQAAILKAEHETESSIEVLPEREWVLPTHLVEKWSLRKFAEVFDSLETLPPSEFEEEEQHEDQGKVGSSWRGRNRQKRLLLATLHDDSTVVYYIIHDGVVKPRQN
jgi:tRNA-splicing endonuclease subunit Sen15